MSNIALVILFNHNYEANIEKLQKIYEARFTNIFFVMPFYKGKKTNVIPVYENSLYFQGYISKALEKINNDSFSHYIIIGDDLILNPGINENNYKEFFNLKEHSGFMPELFLLTDTKQTSPDRPFAPYWPGLLDALKFRIKQKGIEISKFLPNYNDAKNMLQKHGLTFSPKLPWKIIFLPLKRLPFTRADFEYKKRAIRNYVENVTHLFFNRKIPYPLVGAYSDICIIPKTAVKDMIAYCGTFAALNLFVEVALPTAFAFSVPEIITEPDLKSSGLTLWNPVTVSEFENKYQSDLTYLFKNFPADTLYIHPIKLSRWK